MAARTGMIDLILRVRRMVNDTGASVWNDDEVQQVLDAHVEQVHSYPLPVTAEQIGVNEVTYQDYYLPFGNVEGTASGTVHWRVFDSVGETIDPSNYTLDAVRGVVRFDEDQEGSKRYATFRFYDLHGAAADLWEERSGQVAGRYSFSEPGRSFNRSDWFKHCLQMVEYHKRRARPVQVKMYRSDMGEGYGSNV